MSINSIKCSITFHCTTFWRQTLYFVLQFIYLITLVTLLITVHAALQWKQNVFKLIYFISIQIKNANWDYCWISDLRISLFHSYTVYIVHLLLLLILSLWHFYTSKHLITATLRLLLKCYSAGWLCVFFCCHIACLFCVCMCVCLCVCLCVSTAL